MGFWNNQFKTWSPSSLCMDLNAHTQRQTHVQVWIRLLEFPQKYWMDITLCEITSATRTPLVIDSATKNIVFRNYTPLLVDIDLFWNIFHEIMVEKEGFTFKVEVS